MSASGLSQRCYLAEWYRSELTEELLERAVTKLDECVSSVCAQGSHVRLLMALAVPDDQLVFGVFVADSEEIVDGICRQAGIPAHRLSRAIDARVLR
jgi:hypothetical protein